MQSFREFFDQFQDEVKRLFFEMPMAVGDRMPIFDDDDKAFYKYLYDNAPPEIQRNQAAVEKLMQIGLMLRYGRKAKDAGGRGGAGKVLSMSEMGKDTLDYTFNIGGKKFEIKNIPMYPNRVLEKARERGFEPDEHFGFGFGPLNSAEGKRKAKEYADYILTGTEPSDYSGYYSPFRAAKKDASDEVKAQRQAMRQRGVHKTKNKDIDEFQQKSTERIPLDADDKKFLEDFKEKYLQQAGLVAPPEEDGADDEFSDMPLFAAAKRGRSEERADREKINDLLRSALALRYSDHYVMKTNDGFAVRPEFTSRDEPDGFMHADIDIPWGRRTAHVKDVYMNLPALAAKFERYKMSKDFTKEPLARHDMDYDKRRGGIQAAGRWIDSGNYSPQAGVKHGEILIDLAFYKQISEDHELWRKGGGEAVRGKPVADPKLASKLTWRKGDTIIEAPNRNDTKVNYNADDLTWDKLMEMDAKTAVKRCIGLMANTKFKSVPTFREWAMRPENFESAFSVALTSLTSQKTGVDPDSYRSQRTRINNFAANMAFKAFLDQYKLQGAGDAGKDKDDAPSATDTAAARDDGTNVNTGRVNHRQDAPDLQGPQVTSAGIEDDDYSGLDIDPELKNRETGWHAGTMTQMPKRKLGNDMPSNIPPHVWNKMTKAQKDAARRAAGMA